MEKRLIIAGDETMECSQCNLILDRVQQLDQREERRYVNYLEQLSNYRVDRIETTNLLKAIHKRLDARDKEMDSIGAFFMSYMKDEEVMALKVVNHMATTNELLKHVATKEEVTVEQGRINFVYKVGAFLFVCLLGLGATLVDFIVEDIKLHTKVLHEKN